MYEGGRATHAAACTSLSPVSLPSALESGLAGSECFNEPCTRGDSTVCTLVAVLYSVRRLGAVIHLTAVGGMDPATLMNISKAVSPEKTCIVLSLVEHEDDPVATYEIYTSAGSGPVEVREERAISTLLSIQRASSSVVFYWSDIVLGYSAVLNQSPGAMWAIHVSSENPSTSEHRVSRVIRTDLSSARRVLPCFYRRSGGEEMIVMGRGGMGRISWDDLWVGMAALCESTVRRIYCSGTPNGRCFCCQYVVNLHEEVHSERTIPAEGTIKLRLSRKFWQNTRTPQKQT